MYNKEQTAAQLQEGKIKRRFSGKSPSNHWFILKAAVNLSCSYGVNYDFIISLNVLLYLGKDSIRLTTGKCLEYNLLLSLTLNI